MPGSVTELERLVVRLTGDGAGYQKMISSAVKSTRAGASEIDKATKAADRSNAKAMDTATRATRRTTKSAVAGARAVRAARAAELTAAPGAKGLSLNLGGGPLPTSLTPVAVTKMAITQNERYKSDLAEIHKQHRAGAISNAGYRESLRQINQEYGRGIYSLQKYGGAATQAGNSIRNKGFMASLGMTLSVGGYGFGAAKAAMNRETLAMQFQTMLGKNNGAALVQQMQEFADVTPFVSQQVMGAGRVLLGFGVAQENVMDTLKLLGDVSAGTGKDFQELAVIFGQIRGMGRLQGQDFLQLVNAGFPVAEIAKTMGVSMEDLKDKMEKGEVGFKVVEDTFKRVTSEGGTFHNMMANLANTTGGRLSTLKDRITKMAIQFGDILLPVINKVIDAVAKFTGWVTTLSPEVKRMIAIISAIAAAVGPVMVVVGVLVSQIGTVFTLVGGAAGLLSAAFLPIAGSVAGVVAVIAALGLGVAAVVKYVAGKGGLGDAFSGVGSSMKSWAQASLGFILNTGKNFKLLTGWLSENWGALFKDMGTMAMTFIRSMLFNWGVLIKAQIRVMAFFAGYLTGCFKQIFTVEFWRWAWEGVKKVGALLLDFAKRAWETLKSIFTSGDGGGETGLKAVLQTVKNDFTTGMDSEHVFRDAGKIIAQEIGNLKGPLADFKSSLPDLPKFNTDFILNTQAEAKKELEPVTKEAEIAKAQEQDTQQPDVKQAPEYRPGTGQTATGLSQILGLAGQGRMAIEKEALEEQKKTNEALWEMLTTMKNSAPLYGGA